MYIHNILVLLLSLLPLNAIYAQRETAQVSESRPFKVGILVAMEKELKLLSDYWSTDTQAGPSAVVVRLCGIGKVNAALGCASLISEERPDVIVSFGCAGGCGEGVHVGDVVVGAAMAYHDVYCGEELEYGQVQGLPARFMSDSLLVYKVLQSASTDLQRSFHKGLIVSGDWFVDSKEKMRDIAAHFPDAMAVDMESAAIAQTCHTLGVPFVAVRVVSDVPLSDEHSSQYRDFWDNIPAQTLGIARSFVEAIFQ